MRHFRHLVDHHVDDGSLVEVLPGFGLFLKSLGFGEELALDDFGLGLTNRQHLRRFGAADALDFGRLAGALVLEFLRGCLGTDNGRLLLAFGA